MWTVTSFNDWLILVRCLSFTSCFVSNSECVEFYKKSPLDPSTRSILDKLLSFCFQLKYIQAAAVSPDATVVNAAPYISAYVGTPPNPSYRRCSRLLWRLGPAHLIEEPLSGSTADEMYRLGPNYVGSFQAPCPEGQVRVVSWLLCRPMMLDHQFLCMRWWPMLLDNLFSLYASHLLLWAFSYDVADCLFLRTHYSLFLLPCFTIFYDVALKLR